MLIGAVDLFCGVGGLTHGIQRSGIKVVAGIDIDDSCKFPYEHNNHSTFLNSNISDVNGKEINKLLNGYDIKILVGCAPCQPFSSHQKNKKDRKNHKDWSLLYHFSRIVKECKPHIVSMENVPDIVGEQVFTDFVLALERMNYYVTYSIINAADYGVAQRRKRLILLASRINEISLIVPTHANNYISVKDVIGDLPGVSAGESCSTDRLHLSSKLSDLNKKRIQSSIPNGTWRDWPEELILECHKKETGKTYGSVYGRIDWNDLAPTITTQFISYGTGRFGHPEQDRGLTLREGALLQSFPPNYEFVTIDDPVRIKAIARYIGNAVPPKLGEVVGYSIINSLPKKV